MAPSKKISSARRGHLQYNASKHFAFAQNQPELFYLIVFKSGYQNIIKEDTDTI